MNIQPIQKNNVLKTSYRNTVQAPNFAKAVASLYKQETALTTEPIKKEMPELSPVQAYEQMTGSKARKYYDVNGEKWCDENIAAIIKVVSKVQVDTDKNINWESKGGKKLTQEQINEIKGRYNVKNLDAQSCYDLLCDLTNLDVLSAEDVLKIFLPRGPAPSPGRAVLLVNVDRFPKEKLDITGNLINRFKQNYNYYNWYRGYLESAEFNYYNPTLGSSYINEGQAVYKEQADFNLRMAEFFSQFA